MAEHGKLNAPSEWVRRWVPQIPPGARVLDLACGSGRHTRLLARMGFSVCAVDRDSVAVASLSELPAVEVLAADLENTPWPYPGQRFGGIVVTNYLHRPLLPILVDSLDTGGVLIYETFAVGNERYGRPTNRAFLLQTGELLDAVAGRLRVVAYEDLYVDVPKPAMVQRICAQR
jgi:SAM-dependent methyltransferase